MGYEVPIFNMTLEAAADLSAKQYLAIKVDANGKAAVAGDGENAIGILQNVPKAGQAATVMSLGISNAIYGDAVTAGNNVAVDAAGKIVPAVGNDAVLGIALSTGVANQVGSIFIANRGRAAVQSVISIPIKLAKLANGDIVTDYIPGFAGTIKKAVFVVTDPATTANKAATLNLEIEAANVTGGVIALTSANCTPLGAVVAGTAITAANVFTATQKISVEAANVTTFVEGEGVLLLTVEQG